MDVVMVEFDTTPENAAECVAAIREITTSLMSKHNRFHGTSVHIETGSGKVINAMRWDKAQDFIDFRDANQAQIGPALGQFKPSPRFFHLEEEISP